MKRHLCKAGILACLIPCKIGVAMSCCTGDDLITAFYGGFISAAVIGLNNVFLEGMTNNFFEIYNGTYFGSGNIL